VNVLNNKNREWGEIIVAFLNPATNNPRAAQRLKHLTDDVMNFPVLWQKLLALLH
jgi:hypothetical protein